MRAREQFLNVQYSCLQILYSEGGREEWLQVFVVSFIVVVAVAFARPLGCCSLCSLDRDEVSQQCDIATQL